MDVQSLINSRYAIGIGLGLGRIIPPKMGYWLANTLGDRLLANKESRMILNARANQWVVHGKNIESDDLDLIVKRMVRHSARCQYDLYHNIRNPTGIRRIVNFTPRAAEILQETREAGEGRIVVSVHMNNLDLVFLALFQEGINAVAISPPDPGGGYQWQNDLRESFGFTLLPASKSALRTALNTLDEGGIVVTGIDRPIPDMKYRPNFFGYPASLTVVHILLALKTNVPIYVSGSKMDSKGVYHLDVSEPIHVNPHRDRRTEIIQNAEAVLKIAEGFIRQAPYQWSMFFPVWPEFVDEIS
jgi:KDO2-lipid IV(A) lauroyltransferase